MTKIRRRGEQIRRFILDSLDRHPKDIVRVAAERFGISRQAVNQHLKHLIDEKAVVSTGVTSDRRYGLAALVEWEGGYTLGTPLTEDSVWREVAPHLGQLPENVLDIWHYGFTEMFNNVIDHAGGTYASVSLKKTATSTELRILDNGVGIFRKIQDALSLLDERHAVLELAKGKFTTDPAHHTGEGIFFTSRSFDEFRIISGGVHFSHDFAEDDDWILDNGSHVLQGTGVMMALHNHTARRLKAIFDQYTTGDTLGFTKTVVPVRIAQYGDANLVSRSQAKRLLARFDRFRTVILDFTGVASIGQSFADEIFRVFRREHPRIELIATRTNEEVATVIARVQIDRPPPEPQSTP